MPRTAFIFPESLNSAHRTLMTMHMSCPNSLVLLPITISKPQNTQITHLQHLHFPAPSPSDSHHLIQPISGSNVVQLGVITSLDHEINILNRAMTSTVFKETGTPEWTANNKVAKKLNSYINAYDWGKMCFLLQVEKKLEAHDSLILLNLQSLPQLTSFPMV